MKKLNIKIQYLYHSSFVIETTNYLLIFDYYLDEGVSGVRDREHGAIGTKDLESDKKIIVFSSHVHYDHFNPVVLSWKEVNPKIKYVLSSDIPQAKNIKDALVLNSYEEGEIEGLYVKAYGSTDVGVSFKIAVEDITIFHSGDLNCWSWYDDTEEGREKAEKWFREEIKIMESEKYDVAIFPVDPRLRERYHMGPKYFVNHLKPQFFVPMHFDENIVEMLQFKDVIASSNTVFLPLVKRGEIIEI